MAVATILTIRQFSLKHPAFPEGGLRGKVFNSRTNGMLSSGALVRDGRRVLINEEQFFNWLLSKEVQS